MFLQRCPFLLLRRTLSKVYQLERELTAKDRHIDQIKHDYELLMIERNMLYTRSKQAQSKPNLDPVLYVEHNTDTRSQLNISLRGESSDTLSLTSS